MIYHGISPHRRSPRGNTSPNQIAAGHGIQNVPAMAIIVHSENYSSLRNWTDYWRVADSKSPWRNHDGKPTVVFTRGGCNHRHRSSKFSSSTIAMPPRLHLFRSGRLAAIIPRVSQQAQPPLCLRLCPQRCISAEEKPLPKAEKGGSGPNQEQLPHISEEAAAMGNITGEGGPEIDQGTSVQEVRLLSGNHRGRAWAYIFTQVLKRDEESKEKAPQILQEQVQSTSPKGTRSYSTTPDRNGEAMISFEDSGVESSGHSFDLPALPLPANMHLKYRYAPIVKQVTNLLMRDGKLSVAQRVRSSVFPSDCRA